MKREPLATVFVNALHTFCDGAGVALYLQNKDGNYTLDKGMVANVPSTIDADDPALIALRADPAPLEPGSVASTLLAALVLPMAHRSELTGFVCISEKPAGLDYRPDEKELLGWAAHQIGLDLHALRVEHLEANRVACARTCSCSKPNMVS